MRLFLALLLPCMFACAAPHNFDAPGHARIEFRFAENSPGEDTTPARVKGSETEIHLHHEVLFSNADLASVKELRDIIGRAAIAINFTDAAAKRLAEVTGANKGKKLAMIVDCEVLSAPIIQERIPSGEATISGDFTDEEVRGYVDALHGKPKPAP